MILRQSFEDFLRNTVSLDDTRKDRVQSAHWSVRDRLTSIDEVAERVTGRGTYLQGSYPLHTAIRPCDQDAAYDVDIVLAADFRDDKGRMWNGRRVLPWLQVHIESIGLYEGKTTRKARCIRIDYESDNQRFHLDVVPAHRPDTMQGPIQIAPDWATSDPKGYIEWFDEQCREADRLRHVVRLLKYWRNLRGCGPNSMILTTITAHHIPADARSLDDVLVKTMRALNTWMEDQDLGGIEISNPSMPEENLARNWAYIEQHRFQERLSNATAKAEEAISCDDEEETIDLWNAPELFDGQFPKTVRGLGEQAREVAAAMSSGGLAVGPDGRVPPNSERESHDVPKSGGFYGIGD